MANRHAESVYRIVDVVGESSTSWEDAGREPSKRQQPRYATCG